MAAYNDPNSRLISSLNADELYTQEADPASASVRKSYELGGFGGGAATTTTDRPSVHLVSGITTSETIDNNPFSSSAGSAGYTGGGRGSTNGYSSLDSYSTSNTGRSTDGAAQARAQFESSAGQAKDGFNDTAAQTKDDLHATAAQTKDNLYATADQTKDNLNATAGQAKDNFNSAAAQTRDTVNAKTGQAKDNFNAAAAQTKDNLNSAAATATDKYNATAAQAKDTLNATATGIRQRVNHLSSQLENVNDIPAVKNAKGVANKNVAHLREVLGRSPTIRELEMRTGVDRVFLVFGGVLLYLLLIPLNLFGLALPTTALLTVLPAAYLSAETLESPETNANDAKVKSLLAFFVVLGSVQTAESLMAGFLERWIPQYYTVKLVFLAYLLHPKTKGALKIHESVLRPLVTKRSTGSSYDSINTPPTSKPSQSALNSPAQPSSGYTLDGAPAVLVPVSAIVISPDEAVAEVVTERGY